MRPRPKGPEAKAEAKARGYEAEAEAKILASRPVWPRGFHISGVYCAELQTRLRLYIKILTAVLTCLVYI